MSYKFCVSEAEALTKWCPFARTPQEVAVNVEPSFLVVGACNRDQNGKSFDHNKCIGSACMAWRYVNSTVEDELGRLVPSDDSYGYCGLAGDPR